MSKKLHRNGSFRLRNYDYGRNGFYFVTICVKHREHYFGEIFDGAVRYTHLGHVAEKLWQQIPRHFPFVMLDECIVMPDHVHGVIVIDKTDGEIRDERCVGAHNYARLRGWETKFSGNKFGPQSQNLASIIRSYKIAVQAFANRHNIAFAWQPRYHDRIIRTERELNNFDYKISPIERWGFFICLPLEAEK